ncbi:Z-ring formation inhibitor MciZ [Bacillus massiliigorillae]|nr:Z-ring formation inhibitor MciZ [Bacillus massiliigorillae]
MHVHVEENKVLLVGKAWEIREKLKEYSRIYNSVQQWIDAQSTFTTSNK